MLHFQRGANRAGMLACIVTFNIDVNQFNWAAWDIKGSCWKITCFSTPLTAGIYETNLKIIQHSRIYSNHLSGSDSNQSCSKFRIKMFPLSKIMQIYKFPNKKITIIQIWLKFKRNRKFNINN